MQHSMIKLKTVLCSYLIVSSLAWACYEASSPNLPPCPPGVSWPDPCYSQGARPEIPRKAKDASPEGSVTVYVLVTGTNGASAADGGEEAGEGGAP